MPNIYDNYPDSPEYRRRRQLRESMMRENNEELRRPKTPDDPYIVTDNERPVEDQTGQPSRRSTASQPEPDKDDTSESASSGKSTLDKVKSALLILTVVAVTIILLFELFLFIRQFFV